MLDVVGKRRHTELVERAVDEGAVLLRNQLVEIDGAALGRHLGRHDDVDAVRLTVGVLVHPRQCGFELFRVVEPDATEHAQTSRAADRGRDVLGRSESENRVFDAELVGEIRTHQASTLSFADATGAPFPL